MGIRVIQNGPPETVVELAGSINRDSVPEIRKKLLKIIHSDRSPRMQLDFTNVSDIDISGVAMLVEMMRLLSRAGVALELRNLSEEIKRMIRLTRLDVAFNIDH